MLKYYLFAIWQAIVDHGLPLLGMLLLGILIPRIGRLAVRVIESRLDENQESTKARLALAGALVYVAQAVAYFLLVLAALANVGVPPLGAAIPATVVSAAVGFGGSSPSHGGWSPDISPESPMRGKVGGAAQNVMFAKKEPGDPLPSVVAASFRT